MKLCKDCNHIILSEGYSVDRKDLTFEQKHEHAKCKKAFHTDPVTGKTIYYYCKTQRGSSFNDCGPDAKHFEPMNGA